MHQRNKASFYPPPIIPRPSHSPCPSHSSARSLNHSPFKSAPPPLFPPPFLAPNHNIFIPPNLFSLPPAPPSRAPQFPPRAIPPRPQRPQALPPRPPPRVNNNNLGLVDRNFVPPISNFNKPHKQFRNQEPPPHFRNGPSSDFRSDNFQKKREFNNGQFAPKRNNKQNNFSNNSSYQDQHFHNNSDNYNNRDNSSRKRQKRLQREMDKEAKEEARAWRKEQRKQEKLERTEKRRTDALASVDMFHIKKWIYTNSDSFPMQEEDFLRISSLVLSNETPEAVLDQLYYKNILEQKENGTVVLGLAMLNGKPNDTATNTDEKAGTLHDVEHDLKMLAASHQPNNQRERFLVAHRNAVMQAEKSNHVPHPVNDKGVIYAFYDSIAGGSRLYYVGRTQDSAVNRVYYKINKAFTELKETPLNKFIREIGTDRLSVIALQVVDWKYSEYYKLIWIMRLNTNYALNDNPAYMLGIVDEHTEKKRKKKEEVIVDYRRWNKKAQEVEDSENSENSETDSDGEAFAEISPFSENNISNTTTTTARNDTMTNTKLNYKIRNIRAWTNDMQLADQVPSYISECSLAYAYVLMEICTGKPCFIFERPEAEEKLQKIHRLHTQLVLCMPEVVVQLLTQYTSERLQQLLAEREAAIKARKAAILSV